MVNAFNKDILREIKNTAGRFIGILSIVLLGVAFYTGIGVTGLDMKITADASFIERKLMDVRVLSTYGISERDLRAIAASDGISAIHPSHSLDVLAYSSSDADQTVICKAHEVSEDVNIPRAVSGRLPETYDEIAIEPELPYTLGLELGDTLMLGSGTSRDIRTILKANAYRVVGTALSPLYISRERGTGAIGNGQVEDYVLLHPSAFKDMKYYTEVYLTLEDTRHLSAFSDAYSDTVQRFTDALELIGDRRSVERFAELRRDSFAAINASERELAIQKQLMERDFAETEDYFAAQERALENNLRELNAARGDLDRQMAAIGDSHALLRGNITLLENQIASLNSRRRELADTDHSLDTMMQYLPPTDYYNKKTEISQNLLLLEQGIAEAEAGKRELEQAVKTLSDGTADEAYAQLNDGERQALRGRNALIDAWAEFDLTRASAVSGIAASEAALASARKTLNDMDEPEWYILDRDSNYGYAGFCDDTDKISALGTVFPFIFYLVAALVSLTAITRLVDERRSEIGTLKSLGYGTVKIMSKYLLYAFLPAVIGSLAGGLIGMNFFPSLIIDAYSMLYSLPKALTPIDMPLWIRGTGIGMLSTVFAAFLSCENVLRESPSQLLRPKAPKAGGRVVFEYIPFLWKAFMFIHKVTIRNLMRYKKRFWMTVIGIGGCTALLMTGFGIKDSLADISRNQFGKLFTYDLSIHFSSSASDKHINDAYNAMAAMPEISKTLGVYSKMMDAGPVGEGSSSVTLIIPEDTQAFPDFITLKERESGRAVALSENGAVISEKFASNHDLEVGGEIYLKDGDDWHYTTVTGITENYFMHYIYISREAYQGIFNESYKNNGVFGILAGSDNEGQDAVSIRMLDMDGVSGVTLNSVMINTFDSILRSLDFVIIVLIISAGALAFIVLLNLTNINIAERIRELATIEVLGFYDREVSSYIFRENAVLTIIGIALGLVFGIFLHLYVIDTVEVDMMMFGRQIKGVSYLYSIVLTMTFSVLVNILTAGKLKKINMVEALKSVE
jgi:putative ABC transport system permease protein